MIPKTLGACADRLYKLREERSKIQKTIDKLEKEEKEIKEHLINTLPKSSADGITGKVARATIKVKVVPSAKDWSAVYKFILKTKDFSLLGRRLSDAAVRERWEAGKKVPGVEPFNVVSVSVTKA
jgi:hypothetical protein